MPGIFTKKLKSLIRFAVVAVALPLIIATACGTDNVTIGSCCATDGTCTVTTQANCTGTFTANGVCGPNPCVNTLLEGTFSGDNSTSITFTQNPCYTDPAPAHNVIRQNFNAVAGKLVTCSVTGPTTVSRPRIAAGDLMGNLVADSGNTPTSQTTTTTFTPVGNQFFYVTVEDCAASGAANYTLLVTQAK